MTMKLLEAGLSTTVQDLGRVGYQQYGVVVSGVMDETAAKIANVLIGNMEYDAVLELTLIGPTLLFQQNALISICGADLSATIDGKPAPMWKPVYVKEGSILRFGRPQLGCRTYLAAAGGFDLPIVMGSRSTYVRGGIGGFHGRPLDKGDVLKLNGIKSSHTRVLEQFLCKRMNSASFCTTTWTVSYQMKPNYQKDPVIRFIKGPHFEHFTEATKKRILNDAYQVTSNSDRMGYRLSGSPLELSKNLELLSEAVTMGTIQVPKDGQPIILMADRQTIGGYPKIGYVASVDFPVLAQVLPGNQLTFQEISILDAQKLLLQREKLFSKCKIGLIQAFRRMNDGSD
ncbi:biotin-dependent carboxyltransferase family protein [uncultured Metabacillus sp.]|uniref:5-oxoprolinase subunit C family protein n=1 Tax=uncultured Metabacillus sp. TaxID=2860135 RepID=UPI002605D6C4|nr:biotin-dependent carboxyltransferase family protein [uncultured Metabacillus sp.]